MRARSLLSLTLMLPGVVALPAAPATAEVVCQGRPATIVGGPDGPTVGTPGPDVIVSNGSATVDARGGADRICLTEGPYFRVSAGSGDDVVTVDDAASYSDAEVDLGPGDDRLTGRAGADLVVGGGGDDVIATGEGDDTVVVGGPEGRVDGATVSTGGGDDRVTVEAGGLDADSTIAGGVDGTDELRVGHTREVDGNDLVIDVPARLVTRNGTPMLEAWSGFEDYRTDPRTGGATAAVSLTFRGSAADERLETNAGRVVADAGGGDDEVALGFNGRTTGRVDGGTGRNRVVVLEAGTNAPPVVLDLSRGVLRHVRPGTDHGVTLDGFVDAAVRRGGSLLVGDGRANGLQNRCGTVRGLGGADVVRQGTLVYEATRPLYFMPTRCPDDDRFRAEGGRGDDRLYGSYSPDVLLGGPGRDLAEGRAGRDRCEAERRLTCEA